MAFEEEIILFPFFGLSAIRSYSGFFSITSDAHLMCLIDGKQEVEWHHPALPSHGRNLIWLYRSKPFLFPFSFFFSPLFFAQNPCHFSEWRKHENRLESDRSRSLSLILLQLSSSWFICILSNLHPFSSLSLIRNRTFSGSYLLLLIKLNASSE